MNIEKKLILHSYVGEYLEEYIEECDDVLRGWVDNCVVVFQFIKFWLRFRCIEIKIKSEGISQKEVKKSYKSYIEYKCSNWGSF